MKGKKAMNALDALGLAKENLLTAAMFQRQAETILDLRMANAAARNAFLRPQDKQEVEMLLECASQHRQSAIDQLSGPSDASNG